MSKLLLLASLFAAPAHAAEADLAYQSALVEWWSAAGRVWLDEAAYRIEEPVTFQDGVCSATLTEGIAIPVWSGRAPISERIIGFVYVGDGQLEVDIPERADRWRIANHAARYGLFPTATQRAIVHDGAPLRVGVERGLVLSADAKVRDFLVGLEPVGGGTMIAMQGERADGSDEAYVITDSKGKSRAKAIATNLLPNRRLHLQRMGLDPRVWLRQDRLLTEELGQPGEALRLVAEWRTDQNFRIAAEDGAGIAANEYDRWLSCFRDPMDQEELGFESLAFAHGTDPQGARHFERLSGKLLPPPEERHGAWMEGVSADVTVASRPKGFGSERFVDIDEVLELRAVNGDVRHVNLSMPVTGAVRGTWQLDSLSTEDGRELARVALTEDLNGRGRIGAGGGADRPSSAEADAVTDSAVSDAGDVDEGSDDADAGTTEASAPVSTGDATSGLSAGSTTSASTSSDVPAIESLTSDIEASLGLGSAEDQALIKDTPIEHIVQVILPETVPEGETVRLRIRWSARWPFANWSSGQQVLGTTTGMQKVVPEPIPSPGGPRWDTRIRIGIPAAGLNSPDVAVVGDTVREWDEDTWFWNESEAKGVRNPAVAIGRWQSQLDPPGENLPGVRVHLFTRDAWALPQFPPEVRRIVSFFDRFLPSLPLGEIEVFQGPSTFTGDFVGGSRMSEGHGLIAVRTVKTSSVVDQGRIDAVDPYATQSMIARQVAAQHWGQNLRPETSRDAWLTDGLAEAFAAFYVRGAFGNDAYTERMEVIRKLVESPADYASSGARADLANRSRRFLSLTGATPASDVSAAMRRSYGAYVASDLLRLRLGDQAFFSALDSLAADVQGGTVSTEAVQAALEEAAGEPLDYVFDWWVHGGFVPEIEAEVWESEDADGTTTVRGCLRSDLPWGVFDVPVEVQDQDGDKARSVSALVTITDGRGHFEVKGRTGEVDVRIDPLGLIVAYDRQVRKVSDGACIAETDPG